MSESLLNFEKFHFIPKIEDFIIEKKMRAEFGQFEQKNVKILHTSITLYIKKSLF